MVAMYLCSSKKNGTIQYLILQLDTYCVAQGRRNRSGQSGHGLTSFCSSSVKSSQLAKFQACSDYTDIILGAIGSSTMQATFSQLICHKSYSIPLQLAKYTNATNATCSLVSISVLAKLQSDNKRGANMGGLQ